MVDTITIVSPNGGEVWTPGSTQTIRWITTGTTLGPKVKIELLKAGSLKLQIAYDAPNTGSFSWIIPTTLTIGNDYKIRITGCTLSGTACIALPQDVSDQNFAIGTFTTMDDIVANRLKILHQGVQLVPKLIRETTVIIGGKSIATRYYLYMQSTTISDPQAVVTLLDQMTISGFVSIEIGGLSTAGVSIYIDNVLKSTLPPLQHISPEPTLPRSPPYYTFETGAIGYWQGGIT